VLTGCDTGRGNATLGGDLVGLTRALLRGGVDRAVVSLWPVDDEVAPIVMGLFHAGLGTGLAPTVALAEAQRAVYEMSAGDLRRQFTQLGGEPTAENRRRGLVLDPELLDDEEIPTELGGDAERFWAPFILVD
jgi:CHAT domain-containing protein